MESVSPAGAALHRPCRIVDRSCEFHPYEASVACDLCFSIRARLKQVDLDISLHRSHRGCLHAETFSSHEDF
ncbi:hypothetical protein KFK09_008476 [Dendrobium nobile]|uniref:Uncharacterized protein n=1 Tax=Dendrobium nobile TaxID=94219 RepID=A0A8T3BMW0_DENNO|nr:hypothetical protein KFK09_008476 [Dendrobium nobile]